MYWLFDIQIWTCTYRRIPISPGNSGYFSVLHVNSSYWAALAVRKEDCFELLDDCETRWLSEACSMRISVVTILFFSIAYDRHTSSGFVFSKKNRETIRQRYLNLWMHFARAIISSITNVFTSILCYIKKNVSPKAIRLKMFNQWGIIILFWSKKLVLSIINLLLFPPDGIFQKQGPYLMSTSYSDQQNRHLTIALFVMINPYVPGWRKYLIFADFAASVIVSLNTCTRDSGNRLLFQVYLK